MNLEEYQKANPDFGFEKLDLQWRGYDVYRAYRAFDARPKEGMNFTGFPILFLVQEDGEAERVKQADDLFGIMRTLRERKEDT